MKLRMLFYFIFISVLSSCSSLSEETPSISITSDKSTLQVGETVTFTVLDNEDVNITSQSVILIDGNSISGSTFVPLQAKTYEATSSYESLVSNKIDIIATLPSSFSKKAVVEDFTGTWCGWCPRLSYAARLVEEQTDKVFVVGVHLANGDPMENDFGIALATEFSISGFPTAYIDRANRWQGNIEQALNAAEGTVNVGLAIESSLTGSVLDFKVYQGFLENMTDVKLVVYVLEDGILANQINYTSYYGGVGSSGVSTIVDFEHNGVLRYAATDVMGDPTTSTAGVHEKSYSVDLSSHDVLVPENTGVLAMLVDDSGKVLYNAQYVIAGQNQDFD